ncbi:hypothetical protein HHO41_14765 [Bacillus sp. DNRA2]|uniref:DUF6904 family protein n=1 Tax=Bacillus sp. DNRA2 TaxID=2723053 RepID=UPI00145C51D2|nr:hypothetical protein [Bacillus sp. DNRA2]NMD71562.1 hypothetical protein [Bacillus sp. DNRA2]
MIQVKNTQHYTGVTVSGDLYDFEALYDSLHVIVGDEWEWEEYEGARLRVLGVCYDIRHALMGHRDVMFVENGLDQDKMKYLSVVANDKNIYLTCNVLWPEVLFVQIALNDFIRMYAKKQAKGNYNALTDYRTIWDSTIATVRNFQAAIANCIKETIPETSINRVLKLMNHDYSWSDDYATQYLDELNCKFINMDVEKRQKSITVMAKRIAEKGREYQEVKGAVLETARKYNCSMTEIEISTEYPEIIEW